MEWWHVFIACFIFGWWIYWIFVADEKPPKLPPGEYRLENSKDEDTFNP